MSAFSDWQHKVEDLNDRKDRVHAVLLKRQDRVKFTRKRYLGWQKKEDATGSIRAARKEAYWHELFHKAALGKQEYDAREARLAKKLAYLKAHKPDPPPPPSTGFSVPDKPWNTLRRPVSNGVIPYVDAVWNAGWRGYVTSGYRSPQYQCEICRQMCGECVNGCPGRCAPMGQSNHQRFGPGAGAVDVTNYYTFASVARRIGSPLHNSLGAQDPVHFSFDGH